MKRCFLHVGFHKTATTSFQLTLQHNRQLLEDEGIKLPCFRGKKQQFSANHSGQIRDLFDESNQWLWHRNGPRAPTDAPKQQTLLDHHHILTQLLEQHQDILISGEGISTLPKRSLARLAAQLEQRGFQIQPFALVRAPYAYLTSALQQTIKNGKYQPLVGLSDQNPDPDGCDVKPPNTLKAINSLNQIFGERMTYIPFQQATNAPGGPVLYLLKEVLHLQNTEQYTCLNANESKSNASTRLKNFLNQQHPHADQGQLRDLLKNVSAPAKRQKFLLTEQEFARVENEFKKIRREMKRKLGKAFIEERIGFADPFSKQEVNALLSQLCQDLYGFAIKRRGPANPI